MGTGASSYTPPPTPIRPLRNSISKIDERGFLFEGSMLRMDNHVAPVIIKNCMEEYQHVTDFKQPFIYGRLLDKCPQHLLIQGEYFLIKDNCNTDVEQVKLQGMNQARGQVPIFWAAQPTGNQLKDMVAKLENDYFEEILVFNMREEPVLFVHLDGDFIPYTITTQKNLKECVVTGKIVKEADLFEANIRNEARKKQGLNSKGLRLPDQVTLDFIPYTITTQKNLKECVVTGKIVKEADLFEANIRNEVIALATMNDENHFFFYNSTDNPANEPHIFHIEFEDNLLVAEELYSRLAFSNPKLRYRRLCIPLEAAPADIEVDHFISVAQDSDLPWKDPYKLAMLFTCQTGAGRSTVGAVMGYLLLSYRDTLTHKNSHVQKNSSCNMEDSNFWVINKLVSALNHGENIKRQVDSAIDKCCTAHHLLADLVKAQTHLNILQANSNQKTDVHIQRQYQKCRNYLSRYFFLICFNAYIWEQYEKKFKVSFTKWINRHPSVNLIRSCMFLPVYSSSFAQLNSRVHSLVADDYVGLDLLGSQMDVWVANFRKINLKNIPVYGMAQPTNDGLSRVVNYLLNAKVRHTHIVVVNLRNDLMLEIDGNTYSIRDSQKKDEPITFPGFTRAELEEQEESLKKVIREHKTFQFYNDLSDPLVEREIQKAYTILDLADNQQLQTLDMSYYRVPVLSDHSVAEKDIDSIMEIVCSHCNKQERLKDNTDTAFVFFCRTGKSRSTFAMAVAGLIMCHMKGFPKGSQLGEQERISLPNAQYTKGEFIIVQKLVRMLPDGHQVKREVDFILDEIFNTMTPMMFHMREIIFVTYNKMKKCETDSARDAIMCQSILYLERYIYLILFNAYLHANAESHWETPFTKWMSEVGGRAGVYELLDNLGFYDFGDEISEFCKMSVRWKYHVPGVNWQGEFP